MVKLRLTRTGSRNTPCYRIVAIDHRRAGGSRPLEFLGTYDPMQDPEFVILKRERVEAWLAQGAQASPAVRGILKRARRREAAVPAAPAGAAPAAEAAPESG